MKSLPNKIITLVDSLDKEQLMQLNHTVVNLLKSRRDKELIEKASQFKLAEFVFFHDNDGENQFGVVTKINHKSITVAVSDYYTVKVPAVYLHHITEKPSKKLIALKNQLFPTEEILDNLLKQARNELVNSRILTSKNNKL